MTPAGATATPPPALRGASPAWRWRARPRAAELSTKGALAALVAVFAFLLLASLAHAAPKFPALTGRVVDDAHVLSPQAQQELTSELASLEASTGRQLVVVTLPSLQGYAIEDYGYQLGRAWGIGQKGKNNGVLFIIAPNEHKVRIEVGYGLEPVLTDALSSVILQEKVLPKFRSGDIEGGILDGTRALVQQLSLPDDQAKANVAQAAQAPPRARVSPIASIFTVFILFWVLSSIMGALGGRRGGGCSSFWLLPLIFSAGSRRDDWGGGGWGGGGGGGFSGGGGSFGGGGASGNW